MPQTPSGPAQEAAEARRRHFGHFYGLDPFPAAGTGPVVVVHGNCQAGSVRRLLETAGAVAVRVPPAHELEEADLPHLRDLLARADVLVTQPVAVGYRGLPLGSDELAALLPEGSGVVRFPVLRHSAPFPFQVTVRPAFASSIDPPVVPYHDLRTLVLAHEFPAADAFDDALEARHRELTALVDEEAVRRLARDSVEQLARRERGHDAVAASEVLAGWDPADGPSHHTLNHPTNAFFEAVVPLVLRRINALGAARPGGLWRDGTPVRPLEEHPPAPAEQMLGGIRARIEEAPARALGLDAHDWIVGGETVPDGRVRAEQLAWYRRNPRFVEAGLERHRRTLELLGLPVPAPRSQAPQPLHLVVGPPEHGVTACASASARALDAPVLVPDWGPTTGPGGGWGSGAELAHQVLDEATGTTTPPGAVHLHFTDRLFGPDAAAAARSVEELAGILRSRGVRLTATLHDVPQPSDGPGGFRRRTAAYARVVAAADGVVVSSRHEALLLAEAGIHGVEEPAVIPLPLDSSPVPEPDPGPAEPERTPEDPAVLGVFGFLYPGKGHEEAVDAAAAQEPPARVLALGRVVEGHEDLARQLSERAAAAGTGLEITGYVPEERLSEVLAAVDVPLCLHRHFSASGSLNTWIAAGRRPLCLDGRYTREMAQLRPGTLRLTTPERLAEDVAAALADPSLTRIEPGVSPAWGTEDAAAAYRAFFARASGARPAPEISVVVPYYDDGTAGPLASPGPVSRTGSSPEPDSEPRAESLAATRLRLILAALEEQAEAGALEILVVDDGSPAPLAEVPGLPSSVRLLRQEDRGFRAGTARNLGARNARGRVLVFLDGDTVPDPDFLVRMAEAVRGERPVLSVGRRLHADLTGTLRTATAAGADSGADSGAEPVPDSPDAAAALSRARTAPRSDQPRWLADLYARTGNLAAGGARAHQGVISAVLAADTEAFRALGGFDETLVGYGGEDWELAHRAWQAGWTLRHLPEAVAVHDGADWAGRGGRDDSAQRRAKNAETRALAERIPGSWTRPRGVVLPVPELLVRPAAELVAGADPDLLLAWVGVLLETLPDARIEWPAEEVPGLLAADPRIVTASRARQEADTRPGDTARPSPTAWPAPAGPRFLLEVAAPADPAAVREAMARLDDAAENGPEGGPRRRAVLSGPWPPRAPAVEETDGDHAARAVLVTARAAALGAGTGSPGTDCSPGPDGTDEPAPDLERLWGRW